MTKPGPSISWAGDPILFPAKGPAELRQLIERKYEGSGRRISFTDITDENWRWYYPDKFYREVLKEMEKKGRIGVVDCRRESAVNRSLEDHHGCPPVM